MAELSYPNISFEETIVGPTPVRRPWRDRIGVIGEFSRGPTFPVRVSSREEIIRIFGEDASAASLQIQDAQLLGANNFSICRAVPESAPSTASFLLSAGNADLEPVTGFESTTGNTTVLPDVANYTVGLKLAVNYVGSPVVISPTFGSISTAVTELNHAGFSGRANLRLHVIDCVDLGSTTNSVHNTAWSINVNVAATTTTGEYQYVYISKTNVTTTNEIVNVAPFIRPGFELRSATNQRLLIVSPVIDHSPTQWALLVRNSDGAVPITAGNLSVKVHNSPTANYIIGYAVELVESATLVPTTASHTYFTIPNQTTVAEGLTYSLDGYFSLPVAQSSNTHIPFSFLVAPSNVFGGTGRILVTENFGDVGASPSRGLNVLYGDLGASSIPLVKQGAVRISFASTEVTVGGETAVSTNAYPRGTSASTILRDLEAALSTNGSISSLIEFGVAELIVPPYSFTLTSRITGTESNRLFYRLSRYVQGTAGQATDINAVAPLVFGDAFSFTGGFDGPSFASKDFYALNGRPLLRVVAVSPGSYGNQIKVTVLPESSSTGVASYEIVVTDTNSQGASTERWRLTNSEISASGLYLATERSTLIRAYFLPRLLSPSTTNLPESVFSLQPLRIAPALGLQAAVFATGATAVSAQAGSFIRDASLAGAFNFRPSTTTRTETLQRGYLSALSQMESEDVAYVLLPGLTYGDTAFQTVFEAAIKQVNTARVENGLRVALFDAPVGITPRQLSPLTAAINSERVRLVVGHSTSRAFNGRVYTQVGSSGKMAGLLAVRAPHISAASTYGGFLLNNVLSVDTKNSPDYLNDLTNAHADVLYFDSGLGGYKFLNGITTSYDNNRRYGSVRAVMDQIISDLYANLQWIRSEPNTRELQRRVSAAVDARLQQGLRNGSLIRVTPCICGRENNSDADMIAGKLNIAIRVTPVFPADFIRVNVVRDLTENLSLQTASGVSAF